MASTAFRSYLSTEPAVARANQNKFDPVLQFWDRATTLARQGHTVDKVIKGKVPGSNPTACILLYLG